MEHFINLWDTMIEFMHSINFTQIFNWILIGLFIINFLLVLSIIFLERRTAMATWAWILVLFFIPIVGFIIYLLFGRTIYKQQIFKNEEFLPIIKKDVETQLEDLKDNSLSFGNPTINRHDQLARLLLNNNNSFITTHNDITLFTDGHNKFTQLKRDIMNAKHHIHVQYYIFKMDELGQSIYELLVEKQRQGVHVRILYDDLGSRTLYYQNFKELIKLGGQVERFFPSWFPIINTRMNHRNHRKIVVIDGIIGYVGGFNVGDEYLGTHKKFGYWRDNHLRITGETVRALQYRFTTDWNSHHKHRKLILDKNYCPEIHHAEHTRNITPIQIGTSGPDEPWEQIKYGYLKMITSAKQSVYIQTPYFIPDQSFLDAIKLVAMSGVEVNIMIPNKPDHPLVYWGTYYNVGELLDTNANIYIYEKGFLHAKTLVIDGEVSSIGTANFDNRSFALNFEINAFVYDKQLAEETLEAYEEDIKHSTKLTKEMYNERSFIIKCKEAIARLISPVL